MMTTTEEVALSDTSRSFRRASNNEYAFRVPTPPRIIIPPPAVNSQESSNGIRVASVSTIDGRGPNLDFLARVNGGELTTQNAGLEWTYEKRRDAQMVTPYLFLGPHSAAKNRDFLNKSNITMLLAVKQAGMPVNAAARIANEMGIAFHTVDIRTPQDLIASFPSASDLINAHLAEVNTRIQAGECDLQHGKVLVFCESGNEKSAAVVVAWIMEMLHQDFLRAMQFVQGQRFCVNFDDHLKTVLQSYGDILSARRLVALDAASRTSQYSNVPQSSSKRVLARTYEEDMEVDTVNDDDIARFEGRINIPFESID
ncbi:putative fmi2 protein [Botryosphaeria dothidea]|uniref:Putative fmi2 protein n=1 Tax=Botryosphaeria dothidea TaxID=55169 RepID=A0A8H4IKG4_9PEZI|nr:putative fmi2 protein [Botryosphaeria dothidea]KAF4305707.1 putative fmi2 protein [Botryosphaeria dothidea]